MSNFDDELFREIVDSLFKLSESRGKESAGLAFLAGDKAGYITSQVIRIDGGFG